jgi:hypothetical protein
MLYPTVHSAKDVLKSLLSMYDTSLWGKYASALRGPDSNAQLWKLLLTCPIRGRYSGGIDMSYSDRLDYYSSKALVDALMKEPISPHFIHHASDALDQVASYYDRMKMTDSWQNEAARLYHKLTITIGHLIDGFPPEGWNEDKHETRHVSLEEVDPGLRKEAEAVVAASIAIWSFFDPKFGLLTEEVWIEANRIAEA